MKFSLNRVTSIFLAAGIALTSLLFDGVQPVESRTKKRTTTSSSRSTRGSTSRSKSSRRVSSRSSRWHVAAKRGKTKHVAATKTRYAYPIGLFMAHPPAFDQTPLAAEHAERINDAFQNGTADGYAARLLVRSGKVKYHPLRGGIFWRREPVKYIVMHSTETGIPLSAVRVIESWSSMGIRHPGAQYVVDRDGSIYQAVDPDLATVHVNIFKTLPGINNDNSIGIEMCHTGNQDYPTAQRESVTRLVTYLQNRYNVHDTNIITHRYAQQGDHTDPVHFDFEAFLATKNNFKNQAIAYRSGRLKDESRSWKATPEPAVNTYLKIHQPGEAETKPQVRIDVKSKIDNKTKPESNTDAELIDTEGLPDAKTEKQIEDKQLNPEQKQELNQEPKAAPHVEIIEPKQETKPEVKPETKSEPKPDDKSSNSQSNTQAKNAPLSKIAPVVRSPQVRFYPVVNQINGVKPAFQTEKNTLRLYPANYFSQQVHGKGTNL